MISSGDNQPCSLSEITGLATAGSWEWDFKTDHVTWSEGLFRILGLDPRSAEPSFELLHARVHPDDLAGRAPHEFAAAVFGQAVGGEFRILQPDGETRWLASKVEVFSDQDGVPSWAAGTVLDVTEIHEARRELKARERRYHALASAAGIGLWTATGDGKITQAAYWEKFTGQEIAGRACAWLAAVHPDDVESVRSLWLETLRIRCRAEFTFRVRHHDGEYRWVRANAVPIADAQRVSEWVGSIQDIQERRETEIRHRINEEHLRLALAASPMVAWEYELATGHVTVSGNALAALGVHSGPLCQLMSLLPTDDRQRLAEAIRRTIEGEESFTLDLQCRDRVGDARWLHARGKLVRSALLAPHRVVGVALDVTACKAAGAEAQEAREQLRELANRYRAISELVGGIIWTAAPDGKVEDIPAWRDFTGQSESEVRGWGWMDAVHPADREPTREAILRHIHSVTRQEIDYRVRSRTGQYQWFRSRSVPLFREDGRLMGWVGVCQPRPELHDALGQTGTGLGAAGQDLQLTSGAQVRAARAILRWSVGDLAKASGVSSSTIRRVEAEQDSRGRDLSKIGMIRAALEEAGVRFGPVLGGKGGAAPE